MSDIESVQGWNPHAPSCYSCQHYTDGVEHGDYGQILSCEPWCYSFNCSEDDLPGFPYDDAPTDCVGSGRYSLDVYYAFWCSPFCENLDGSNESTDRAFQGFIWWLENIKAVGL